MGETGGSLTAIIGAPAFQCACGLRSFSIRALAQQAGKVMADDLFDEDV